MLGRRVGIVLVASVVLAVSAHFRGLEAPFVWDDFGLSTDNPALTEAGAAFRVFGLQHWARPSGGYMPYRPVRNLIFIGGNALFEGRSRWFHVLSLSIHIANILLVYAVASRMTRSVAFGGISAMLFAAHPAHIEAVTWAKNVAEVAALFFGLVAALCFMLAVDSSKRRGKLLAIAAATVAFAGGLLCKESVAAFPAILLLWSLLFRKGEQRRAAALLTLPLWLVAAAYAPLQYFMVSSGGKAAFAAGAAGPQGRLAMAAETIGTYLGLAFVPFHNDHWRELGGTMSLYPAFALFFVVAAALLITLLLVALRRRWGGTFGLWWFLLSLSPVANLLVVKGRRPVAEQRLYTPSVGWAMLMAAAILYATKRTRSGFMRWALPCVIAIAFAALAAKGTEPWRNDLAFWRSAVKTSPEQADTLYNLGVTYGKRRRDQAALEEYRKAILADAGQADYYYNMGNSLGRLGQHQEAVRAHRTAAELGPDVLRYRANLAMELTYIGAEEEARKQYRTAEDILAKRKHSDREEVQARSHLARVAKTLGYEREAKEHLIAAVRLGYRPKAARVALARLHLRDQEFQQAAQLLKSLISEYGTSVELQRELARAYLGANDHARAIEASERALELDPEDRLARALLVRSLLQGGIREQLLENAQTLVAQAPEHPEAHVLLGHALRRSGDNENACREYESALQLDSDNLEALTNLGDILASASDEKTVERGLALLAKAAAIAPESVQLARIRAAALEKIRRYEEALRVWEKLLKLVPGDPEAKRAMARLKAKMSESSGGRSGNSI